MRKNTFYWLSLTLVFLFIEVLWSGHLYANTAVQSDAYVDLGLTSGTKWAIMNVGATTAEDYGEYYAWGETEAKTSYTWSNYLLCSGTSTSMNKYCTSNSYGTVDDKQELESTDDAATVNWGANWKTPSYAQWCELKKECTWTYVTVNGVGGYNIKGSNGNTIFIPCAGIFSGTSYSARNSSSCNVAGSYWSSTMGNNNIPYNLDFDRGGKYIDCQPDEYRYTGQSIRPVYVETQTTEEEETKDTIAIIPMTGITLSRVSATLVAGDTLTITAMTTPSNVLNSTIIWSSSNDSIVSVSAEGVIYAHAKGNATITATAADGSGVKAMATIYVMSKIEPLDEGDDAIDYTKEYLTVLPWENGTITFELSSNSKVTSCSWSYDKTNWHTYKAGDTLRVECTRNVPIYFKGNATSYSYYNTSVWAHQNMCYFRSDCYFSVRGNVMSMLNDAPSGTSMSGKQLALLFAGCNTSILR